MLRGESHPIQIPASSPARSSTKARFAPNILTLGMNFYDMKYRDKLLMACGVQEGFNVRDLIKPDPKRTRRNLSAIINFHKFREERLAVYAQFSDKGVSRYTQLCC